MVVTLIVLLFIFPEHMYSPESFIVLFFSMNPFVILELRPNNSQFELFLDNRSWSFYIVK